MSLDVYLTAIRPTRVHEGNITHNLGLMAKQVDLYMPLWRPEELGITKAGALIPLLRSGLSRLIDERVSLQQFNPSNGWGNYEGLLNFTREYLAACQDNPDADIEVSR